MVMEMNDYHVLMMSRAELARSFPIEELMVKYFNGVMLSQLPKPKRVEAYRIARKLCNKALEMLPHEISIRGSQTVLDAIAMMESLRTDIDEILLALEAS